MVAAHNNSIRTQLARHAHGHGRMDTVRTRFVTARGYHAPIATATYQNGFTNKFRIDEPFYRHKKTVQIHMHHLPVHLFFGPTD